MEELAKLEEERGTPGYTSDGTVKSSDAEAADNRVKKRISGMRVGDGYFITFCIGKNQCYDKRTVCHYY